MIEKHEEGYVSLAKSGAKYSCYLVCKRILDIFLISFRYNYIVVGYIVMFVDKMVEDFHNPVFTSIRVGKDGRTFKFHKNPMFFARFKDNSKGSLCGYIYSRRQIIYITLFFLKGVFYIR